MTIRTPSQRALPAYTVAADRLTARDELLLRWLADHRVLTTTQITAALFGSARRCQARLADLRQLGFLDCSMPRSGPWVHGESLPRHGYHGAPMLHVLGPHGYTWAAARNDTQPLTERRAKARNAAIMHSHHREHTLGVNGFFIALAAHARRNHGYTLLQWLNEERACHGLMGVRPDGYGEWSTPDGVAEFYLEYDTGKEQLHLLAEKVAAYAAVADFGLSRPPVVFWLHSPRRERNLHQLLISTQCSGYPVATGLHGSDPAADSFLVVGGDSERVSLNELENEVGGL